MTQSLVTTHKNAISGKVPAFIHLVEKEGEKAEIRFENLNIELPRESRTLIDNGNITILEGHRVGFTGPNGSGKSSLFRAARGLDSYGSGKIIITLPPGKGVFCASQEIRKVPLTLPGLLAYPRAAEDYPPNQFESVLHEAGLDKEIIQLPWNAVQPDNIIKILTPLLVQSLEKYAGKITEKSASLFHAAFAEAINNNLSMPQPLAEFYTQEIHKSIIEKIMHAVSEALKPNSDEKQSSLFFSARTGRSVAKSFAENAKGLIDGWLLQGHRIRLSGGEQQRLIFARMFLQGGDISIFLLDEVTAAMKKETAHEMYEKLNQKFPDATIIGIVHDESLLEHFTHHMELGTDKKLTISTVPASQYTYRSDHLYNLIA